MVREIISTAVCTILLEVCMLLASYNGVEYGMSSGNMLFTEVVCGGDSSYGDGSGDVVGEFDGKSIVYTTSLLKNGAVFGVSPLPFPLGGVC